MLDVSSEKLPSQPHGTIVLHSIFHTLAYADVFDYPLTADEVYRYLGVANASLVEITRILTDTTLFSNVENYYTLRGREEIVKTRKQRAEVARRLWPKAARYGRIIASLPFVRMVAVTGSLAMDNTDVGKDIDYMIITVPGHLWTCRAFSLLVARIARLEGVELCPNYLVTTRALELEEQSLYVAHELAQMIPLSGMEFYDELRRLNAWTSDYLPNSLTSPEMRPGVQSIQGYSFLKKVLEFLFRLPFANWFEKWEMYRKVARLKHEQTSSSESYFSADVCKGHIDRHAESVTTAFAVRMEKATDPQGVLRTPVLADGARKVATTRS
jgi:hypothetical protein